MKSNFVILKNEEEIKKFHEQGFRSRVSIITEEDIKALQEGKCLGFFDGEYTSIIKLGEKRTMKRLKKLRIDHGYTIYSLADKLKVDPSSVSYWESGDKFPRRKKMEQLEDLFGVSYRELFSDLSDEEVLELEQRKNNNNKDEKL